jgi:hypothetical protein
MPFDIEGHGWELHVKRLGLQHGSGDLVRTYARTKCTSTVSRLVRYQVISASASVRAIIP